MHLQRFLVILLLVLTAAPALRADEAKEERPNILLLIADDWGWPFASAYGDPVVRTPEFDRLAAEGALFQQAFVSSPSCTPSRAALLTGQQFWRLEESANLWSTFQPKFRSYPEILQEAGYIIGSSGKAWGPGDLSRTGRSNPAGPSGQTFEQFLRTKPAGKPFCFWQGSSDPHRPYDRDSGKNSGMDLGKIQLPPVWPDHDTVRRDLADYFFEVQRFDQLVGRSIALLKEQGLLENTVVVVTGDNGAPFPRGKTQLYDLGVRVPLAIRWGNKITSGQRREELVSLTDLAPTFLDAAGLKIPSEMTGRTLLPLLQRGEGLKTDFVLFGRERHTLAQNKSQLACPMRAIRTRDYLFIWNVIPERWPSGTPPDYTDCDGGPTKDLFLEMAGDPAVKKHFDLAFARRGPEELYDLRKDPHQMTNAAGKPELREVQRRLAAQLQAELKKMADPRVTGGGEKFDQYEYVNRAPRPPRKQ